MESIACKVDKNILLLVDNLIWKLVSDRLIY